MKKILYFLLPLFLCAKFSWAEIYLTDSLGSEIVLQKSAQRIVALSPHIVENIFAAGAGDLLVGVVEYSDFPSEAKELTVVGGFASLNVEHLLSLQPDLVIAWGSGNKKEIIELVKALGIPVYIDEPQALQDIPNFILTIGKATEREQQARQTAFSFMRKLAQLEITHTDVAQLSVLYQIWHEPIQTVNNEHLITKVIELCGGYNAFGDAVPAAPVINRETVIARNPDVIIASGESEDKPVWLDEWQKWPQLSAVKNQNIFHISPDLLQRHTPRILDGAKMMCDLLDGLR